MSGGGILGTGTSALLTYQRALQTTGHNIANVGTEGFSRQRLELSSLTAGAGGIGAGVQGVGVRRVVDQFVDLRLGMNISAESQQRTLAEFASQLDNLLADPQAGLTPALSRFFAAIEDVATDPTSTAARQQLLSQGQGLVDRFAQLEGRIEDQRVIVNGRIGNAVDEVNQLSRGIAELNRSIVEARGRQAGREPNDLLDQRDQLVRDLSARLAISTVEQSDGSLNVYGGRGQSLVVGLQATELVLRPQGADPDRLEIGVRNGTAFVPVTDNMSGGSLGALLETRDTLLDPASNSLGRIAVALTDQFNELHRAGMDLRGQAGEPFFSRPAPEVLANLGNAADGKPALVIDDIGALSTSDYQLRFDGNDWVLRRLQDGQVIGSIPPGGALDFDGLSVDLDGVTGGERGDSFLLRPLRVAGGLEVRVTDPRSVAAALPVQAQVGGDNAGNARVQTLAVDDPDHPELRSAATIEFVAGSYVVGGESFPLDASGDTRIDHNGWSLVLRGTPQEGDRFEVGDNAGAVGDNRGALAMAQVGTQRGLAGGSATLSESYSELVADVAVRTQRAKLNADVQGRLLSEARSQRESISGVNLDEEAANLVRFQQAYQAAAQVVAAAGNMFDTLLAAVRR